MSVFKEQSQSLICTCQLNSHNQCLVNVGFTLGWFVANSKLPQKSTKDSFKINYFKLIINLTY